MLSRLQRFSCYFRLFPSSEKFPANKCGVYKKEFLFCCKTCSNNISI